MNPKYRRLSVDLTIEEHTELKKRAADRGVSIRMWLRRAIAEAILKEKKYE